MKRMLGATAVLSAVFVIATLSPQGFSQPLPDDIKIVKASASVAPEKAAFIGKWTGNWGGSNLPTILLVEGISDEGEVSVVYAWGNAYRVTPGFSRPEAKFKGDKLTWGTRPKFEFVLLDDGTMRGKRIGGGTVIAKLKRAEE